jgi:hypothetical protein
MFKIFQLLPDSFSRLAELCVDDREGRFEHVFMEIKLKGLLIALLISSYTQPFKPKV